MVQPNAPRFLSEGDKIEFSTKIANLTDKELTARPNCNYLMPSTNEAVSGWFNNICTKSIFYVAAGQSEASNIPIAMFPIYLISLYVEALVVARAGD